MPRRRGPAIPAAPRKTLLEWIELDDGDTTDLAPPTCSTRIQALHARILLDPEAGTGKVPEPVEPPSALRLAPLG